MSKAPRNKPDNSKIEKDIQDTLRASVTFSSVQWIRRAFRDLFLCTVVGITGWEMNDIWRGEKTLPTKSFISFFSFAVVRTGVRTFENSLKNSLLHARQKFPHQYDQALGKFQDTLEQHVQSGSMFHAELLCELRKYTTRLSIDDDLRAALKNLQESSDKEEDSASPKVKPPMPSFLDDLESDEDDEDSELCDDDRLGLEEDGDDEYDDDWDSEKD